MTPAISAASPTGFRHSQVVVDDSSVHVVQASDPDARPFVFLHGWPESWRAWHGVMAVASPDVPAIAIDLPGRGSRPARRPTAPSAGSLTWCTT